MRREAGGIVNSRAVSLKSNQNMCSNRHDSTLMAVRKAMMKMTVFASYTLLKPERTLRGSVKDSGSTVQGTQRLEHSLTV